MPEVFLSRQPLINRQNRILANRLTLHLPAGATADDVFTYTVSDGKGGFDTAELRIAVRSESVV